MDEVDKVYLAMEKVPTLAGWRKAVEPTIHKLGKALIRASGELTPDQWSVFMAYVSAELAKHAEAYQKRVGTRDVHSV